MVTLRTDQTDLIDRTSAAMRRTKRVCIQAGCGYGKTHVFAEIVRRADAKGKRTLILAHRRRLIEQISDRLEMFGVGHRILMAQPTERLSGRSDSGARVCVCSKDTLISRAVRNDWSGFPPADLVIADEAHNLLAPQYGDILNRYPDAYRLGFTATPVSGDGRGLGGIFDELVCAPPVSQLIAANSVVPFKVFAALELRDLRKSGGKIKPAGDPVTQWLRHAEGRPTVLFAPKVSDSRKVVESFLEAGIHAVHIDSHSTEEERDDAAAGLESGRIKVVSQVNLWSEGVDVPCIGCVQLLSRCGSLVKYVQAVWRAGRKFPGKQYAIVIDHTAAVFEHGFPDDDIEWELTSGEAKNKTAAGEGGDGGSGEPFVCAKCGHCYRGGMVCPNCGHTFAINRKMYQPDLFGHLVEVDRDFNEAVKAEAPQRTWTSLLFQFARTGKTVKAVSAAFRARTGKWPGEAGVTPVPDRSRMNDLLTDVYPKLGPRVKATPDMF